MIVFDLKCGGDHVFEAWFGSSAGYEEQCERGLIACPVCGATDVTKAVMAPNIGAKGNSRAMESASAVPKVVPVAMPPGGGSGPPLTPEIMKAALQALASAQAEALKSSQWVGRSFADRARAMHDGDEEAAPIHGQSSPEEVRELIEDGVPIAPLLVPVVPPEALN